MLIVRPYTPEDLPGAIGMLQQLWTWKSFDVDSTADIISKGIASGNNLYFCAVDDRKIVGFCSVEIQMRLFADGAVAYIETLVVDESLRGKGIGAELVSSAADEVKSRGCKKFIVDCSFSRERSHEFYEKQGFEKTAFLFIKDLM